MRNLMMQGRHQGERILLASNNAGKVREINQLLASQKISVIPQSDLGVPEVAETGLSFVENAIIKARHAALHGHMAAIADDSGLEVDALEGAPGVYSARYAGLGATDRENLDKLLQVMADIPAPLRTARFQCVMVYMRQAADPTPIICQGTWEGEIALVPQGGRGFGYDPLFFVPSHGCTAAELSPEVKNQLSHRGQALRQLLARLSGAP